MKQEFIQYQQALDLKELGFDESCLGFYEFGSMDEEWHLRTKYVSKNEYNDVIHILKAPLYQQAFRWFREKYKLKFHIKEDNWNNWCSFYVLISDEHERVGDYLTYEEAELACLRKLIEIVKTK